MIIALKARLVGHETQNPYYATIDGEREEYEWRNITLEALREWEIFSEFNKPEEFVVEFYVNDKDKRVMKSVKVVAHQAEPTTAEFHEALDETVEGLPVEFAEYVMRRAYEIGSGYIETVNIARGMAEDLREVLLRYKTRTGSEACG